MSKRDMWRRISLTALVFSIALLVAYSAHAEPKKVGRALLTYYWLIDEASSKYRGKKNAVLRDARGRVLAKTTMKFKRDLVMEGSGWLQDGRTVIYEQRVGSESRFRISSTKYGLTVTGCAMDPYRTVAVDPRFVKLGTTIYIPAMKGAKLPDGTTHDGMFIANDRGHFRGPHVDVFVGAGARSARPFLYKGVHSRARINIYIAEQQKPGNCVP